MGTYINIKTQFINEEMQELLFEKAKSWYDKYNSKERYKTFEESPYCFRKEEIALNPRPPYNDMQEFEKEFEGKDFFHTSIKSSHDIESDVQSFIEFLLTYKDLFLWYIQSYSYGESYKMKEEVYDELTDQRQRIFGSVVEECRRREK